MCKHTGDCRRSQVLEMRSWLCTASASQAYTCQRPERKARGRGLTTPGGNSSRWSACTRCCWAAAASSVESPSGALGSGVLKRPKRAMAGCLVWSRYSSCSSQHQAGTGEPSVPRAVTVGVGRITGHHRARRRRRGPPHERDAPWQPTPAPRPQPPLPATSIPPRWPTSCTSSPKTVSRWAKEGKLPFLKTLGGHRRYPEAEIRELAEELREEAMT